LLAAQCDDAILRLHLDSVRANALIQDQVLLDGAPGGLRFLPGRTRGQENTPVINSEYFSTG
jgi:hypothetical protein